MKTIKTIVYIGRFQPFHNAHLATIRTALSMAERVIVVIGSSFQPRSINNPFNETERIKMISDSVGQPDRLQFVKVENQVYNDIQWGIDVAQKVHDLAPDDSTTKLIGHSKDESSFYLKMFPQWGAPIETPLIEVLDATTIRKMYFGPKVNLNFFRSVVPEPVVEFMGEFLSTEEYQNILAEVAYIEKYRKPYDALPYPVTFNTGDAVVVKSGHVLLIRRRAHPGKGLYALPGGFLNANTDASLRDCAVRELIEETGIKVPVPAILGSIKEEKVFDANGRSSRGRIITTAQLIVLDDKAFPGLPKVKGSDDAEAAMWVPFHKLDRTQMFEDHYDILTYFMGRLS